MRVSKDANARLRSATLSMLILAFGNAAPVPAAAAPAGQGPEITVTARRPGVDRIIAQASAISQTYGGQLTRFEDPVCPMVTGLPDAMASTIADLIRADADKVGATPGKAACTPNLVIFIADDGKALLRKLFRRNANLFSDMELHERERFLEGTGPAWAWKTTLPKRRDGGPVNQVSSISFGPNDPPRASRAALTSRRTWSMGDSSRPSDGMWRHRSS